MRKEQSGRAGTKKHASRSDKRSLSRGRDWRPGGAKDSPGAVRTMSGIAEGKPGDARKTSTTAKGKPGDARKTSATAKGKPGDARKTSATARGKSRTGRNASGGGQRRPGAAKSFPKAPAVVAEERLSRFLASAGVASRRHVDGLIEEGRVKVNGTQAVLGQKVRPGRDRVYVDGREVGGSEKPVYVLLHKPPGYLSTCSDPNQRDTVMSLVEDIPARMFPVGRLDYDAAGLLLMTNDGDLAYLLTHPKHRVVKEYVVEISGARDDSKIGEILSGMIIGGKKVEVDFARFLDQKWRPLRLVVGVHEGEKHLVKHICHAVGYGVKRLTRTKMGSLGLTGLDPGEWRHLTPKEVEELYKDARKGLEGERDK